MNRDGKWSPEWLIVDEQIPMLAYGAAVFAQTMRGKKSGVARRCFKKLKEAEKNGLLVVVLVDEFRTSKVRNYYKKNFIFC